MIIGSIFAILLLILIYLLIHFNGTSQAVPTQTDEVSTVAISDKTTEPQSETTTNETETFKSDIQLINESVLSTAVSEQRSLAEDELAGLTDIEKQLDEQKALLEQQHQNADQLIALKEEQIAVLEAQLKTQ